MASRVEKYYEEVSTSKKRVVKNRELYKAIYAEDETYSNIEGVLETPVTNEIDILRTYGFKICLDSFNFNNSSFVPMIWNMVGIDYIKFDDSYWKIAMNDKKVDNALKHTTESYLEYGTIPIFSKVENDIERKYISTLHEKCLVYGRGYSKEYQIKKQLV